MKSEEKITMKAIALCFKPFLKPEEAYIYTNLEHTRFMDKCKEHGIYKNEAGYYSKSDLDSMMSGNKSRLIEKANNIKL